MGATATHRYTDRGLGSNKERVMKISATCVSIVTLVLATACGASEDSDTYGIDLANGESSATEEAAAMEGNLETLHRFEVQGTTYAYLRDGDDVMLQVQSSRTAPRLSVQTETGAAPTLLEVFNALQPGVEPHPALLAAHRESAPVLGRSNDAVLRS